MEYNINNVCTVLDTKEVKLGDKGYFADNLGDLKEKVNNESTRDFGELTSILSESRTCRFRKDDSTSWALFYPVEKSTEELLTLDKLTSLSGDGVILDTYDLLTYCAEKVAEATKAYAKLDYDIDIAHIEEHKAEFTKAVADIVCHCGAIAYKEGINLNKAVADRLK